MVIVVVVMVCDASRSVGVYDCAKSACGYSRDVTRPRLSRRIITGSPATVADATRPFTSNA